MVAIYVLQQIEPEFIQLSVFGAPPATKKCLISLRCRFLAFFGCRLARRKLGNFGQFSQFDVQNLMVAIYILQQNEPKFIQLSIFDAPPATKKCLISLRGPFLALFGCRLARRKRRNF